MRKRVVGAFIVLLLVSIPLISLSEPNPNPWDKFLKNSDDSFKKAESERDLRVSLQHAIKSQNDLQKAKISQNERIIQLLEEIISQNKEVIRLLREGK